MQTDKKIDAETHSALVVGALLVQAGANAKHNQGALKSKLYVSECYADQGPYLKRMRPRAQGR
jgi:large subunit ribosomal protein L22